VTNRSTLSAARYNHEKTLTTGRFGNSTGALSEV
jgi:hypothetical protein